MTATLLQGDCLTLLNEIASRSVDLVLADLPYGTTRCKWDCPIDLPRLWKHLDRVCRPDTPILLFAQTPFDKVLGASNLSQLRYEWIWEKGAATGFLNAKRAPLKAHENILVFYKKLPRYCPIMGTGARKTSVRRESTWPGYNDYNKEVRYDSTARYPRSVLRFSSDKQKVRGGHPTAKPVALLDYLIRTYTEEGNTVLDFCMGGGSAAEAAILSNRQFIGIEKDPKFFTTSQQRVARLSEVTRC